MQRPVRSLLGLAGVALVLIGCSRSAAPFIVPITAIATSQDARLLVTAAVGSCADAGTDISVQESPTAVTLTVRFTGSDCGPSTDFEDLDIQLDGALGARSLVLTQPLGYETIVGRDVCIIDGEQQSNRCSVVVTNDG